MLVWTCLDSLALRISMLHVLVVRTHRLSMVPQSADSAAGDGAHGGSLLHRHSGRTRIVRVLDRKADSDNIDAFDLRNASGS